MTYYEYQMALWNILMILIFNYFKLIFLFYLWDQLLIKLIIYFRKIKNVQEQNIQSLCADLSSYIRIIEDNQLVIWRLA